MENVIIGNLLVEPHHIFGLNKNDWNEIEKDKTLFTDEKFIPRIMVQAGIVNSVSEVRRNRPDLMREGEESSCEIIKWGNSFYSSHGEEKCDGKSNQI